MEDIRVVFASNLIRLRTEAGLTQAELAEKINYSDKSISKWERAEALPDVAVVKRIAGLFDVPVDFLLETHDSWEGEEACPEKPFSTGVVTLVTMLGIWTLAILLFVIFWMLGRKIWMIFLGAVPISLVTLLVLNSIWNERKHNYLIVSGIVLALFILVYCLLYSYHPWQLIFVAIPSEAIVYFSFKIKSGLKWGKNSEKQER